MDQSPTELFQQKQDTVLQLWQQGTAAQFINRRQNCIHYFSLTSTTHDKVVFICNGRCESYLKYQELVYDLYQQGFDSVLIDHCGQGLSQRLLSDPELGHIECYQHYVDDMKQCVDLTISNQYKHRYLLGHSMGGTIATLFIQQFPIAFDKVILCAPLFDLYLPCLFKPIAKPLAQLLEHLESKPNYTFSQKPYWKKPFEHNKLSHCRQRYLWWQQWYELKPQLKLGGPSNHWIVQSYHSFDQIFKQISFIQIPCLIWQAQQEFLVSNSAQNKFYRQMKKQNKNVQLQRYKHSKHEILFEQDSIRDQAFAHLLAFFTH